MQQQRNDCGTIGTAIKFVLADSVSINSLLSISTSVLVLPPVFVL